jgi:serine/threonine protein kinase
VFDHSTTDATSLLDLARAVDGGGKDAGASLELLTGIDYSGNAPQSPVTALSSASATTRSVPVLFAALRLVVVWCNDAVVAQLKQHLDQLEEAVSATDVEAQRHRLAHGHVLHAVHDALDRNQKAVDGKVLDERDGAWASWRQAAEQVRDIQASMAIEHPRLVLAEDHVLLAETVAHITRQCGLTNSDQLSIDSFVAVAGSALSNSRNWRADSSKTDQELPVGVRQSYEEALSCEASGQIVSIVQKALRVAFPLATCKATPLVICVVKELLSALKPILAIYSRSKDLSRRYFCTHVGMIEIEAGLAQQRPLHAHLKESAKQMKKAREQLQKHIHSSIYAGSGDSGDETSDSDDGHATAGGSQPDDVALCLKKELVAATAARDAAARSMLVYAQTFFPEAILREMKRLQLSGLNLSWSCRTLEDYDARAPMHQSTGGRHHLFKATYNGHACVLKQVPLAAASEASPEVEALRRLDHPNVVKLEAIFYEPTSLSAYLHLPFARHGDLAQFVEAEAGRTGGGRVGVSQLAKLARGLCQALAYLADRSIVHCDVKPANVLIDIDDASPECSYIAILGDFDVSHTASGRTATMTMAVQTRALATHYTAGYAAPEIVLAEPGRPPRATHKLDIYGFGCTLYFMYMYPRTLPEPSVAQPSVVEREGAFEAVLQRGWPAAAVSSWAAAVPADLIRRATSVAATARATARDLLKMDYMRHAGAVVPRSAVQLPAYWLYQDFAVSQVVEESAEVCAAVELLMNQTAEPATHGVGSDSHRVCFKRFVVKSVRRAENSRVWWSYAGHRQAFADELVRAKYTRPTATALRTGDFSYPLETGSLDMAAGEVFLFHGSARPESIFASGFDVRYAYAGAGAGAMFGHGVYFAESASKADQYVPGGRSPCTMMLARVALGRCCVVNEPRWKQNFLPEVEGLSTQAKPVYYDSIIADVPGMRFREVVVGRDSGIYPELLIEYVRAD